MTTADHASRLAASTGRPRSECLRALALVPAHEDDETAAEALAGLVVHGESLEAVARELWPDREA